MLFYTVLLVLTAGALMCNACITFEKAICKLGIQDGFCMINGRTTKFRLSLDDGRCVPYQQKCDASPNKFNSMEECQRQCGHLIRNH
ncbi:hypothetical protein CLF_102309 [Clonorchis sinensis]|uniref:BPTI/Kunitz inhibitor domain-containing protein n=1 Tax=Clonorchis sinensis TaxID=79923 RepID=G7YN08_CLOSI|nr:hypothetical protein CLF_102309 [Clonorchis sinensis]